MGATGISPRLTRRQRQCMALVAEGQTAKQIARFLGISHRTVEQHIAAAIEALEANNRLGAVARFLELEQQRKTSAQQLPPLMLQAPPSPDEAQLVEPEEAEEEAEERTETWPLLPPLGGSANHAPREVRIEWMLRIAILAIMLTCAAILSILGVMEIAR